MKLKCGDKLPNFEYLDLEGNKNNYYDLLTHPRNAVIFLRYYGCTVCQLNIIELQERFSELDRADIGISVVLQSDPAKLKEELADTKYSFNLLLDPNENVYKALSIDVAESMEELGGGNTVARIKKATEMGLVHGRYEGNEMQLPASFVVDKEGVILSVKYGEDATDVMSIDEILVCEI